MDNYFEHIQDYLDGSLAPADMRRFEEALTNDADLRRETAHQRMLRETIAKQLEASQGVPALTETLQAASRAHFAKARKPKYPSVVRWLIPLAAAACLLLVLTIPGLWTVNFERLPDMPVSVTRGVGSDDLALQAAEAFNAKDYSRSVQLLEALVAHDTANMRNRYYLGLSYLGAERHQQSADVLRPVADGKAVYADDARYFLAVALWRLGDAGKALRYATQVTPRSSYHQKAQKLADRLAQ